MISITSLISFSCFSLLISIFIHNQRTSYCLLGALSVSRDLEVSAFQRFQIYYLYGRAVGTQGQFVRFTEVRGFTVTQLNVQLMIAIHFCDKLQEEDKITQKKLLQEVEDLKVKYISFTHNIIILCIYIYIVILYASRGLAQSPMMIINWHGLIEESFLYAKICFVCYHIIII